MWKIHENYSKVSVFPSDSDDSGLDGFEDIEIDNILYIFKFQYTTITEDLCGVIFCSSCKIKVFNF